MKVGKFSFFKRDAQMGEISSSVNCSSRDSDESYRFVVLASEEIASQR